ncbi:type II secretion system protein [Clostridium sp.]|uniref:type II secretion system protein n=1 Tax=Clostridium sp. TaxID=1506 RepID=UPI003216D9F1
MIKRTNNKKKKGFTLIELIIVLAVMAIIALIAIPNFAAVRNNSKVKADKQSCETIERTILMLVSDETITGNGTVTVTVSGEGSDKEVVPTTSGDTLLPTGGVDVDGSALNKIKEALKDINAPQGKTSVTTKDDGKDVTSKVASTKYVIEITDGSVNVSTAQ